MVTAKKAKIYVRNADLMEQIDISKRTYSAFAHERYAPYDLIVESFDEMTAPDAKAAEDIYERKNLKYKAGDPVPGGLARARAARARRLGLDDKAAAAVKDSALVFRLMTYDHIPDRAVPKRNPKKPADHKEDVNFPPFRHYVLRRGKPVEVGRSHWAGGLAKGRFSTDHGRITDELAGMWMKMIDGVGRRANWSGYNYLADMQQSALLHLMKVGLQFNEARSSNPFAYLTQIINHCFTAAHNTETRQKRIRDDMLIGEGMNPSAYRQGEEEWNRQSKDYERRIKSEAEKQGINTYSDWDN